MKPYAVQVRVDPTGLVVVTGTNVQTALAQLDAAIGVGSYVDPLTTKGDLVGRSASATVRIPVGSNGQVLTADSTNANGVAWAAAGAGGVTQSYLGTNSVGASWESLTVNRYLMKKITLATAGMLVSIDMHVRDSGSSQVGSMNPVVWADSSGTPGVVVGLAAGSDRGDSWFLSGTARWVSFGAGIWLPAGDYWIGGAPMDTQSIQLAYAASGSDRYFNSGGGWVADATSYANTTTSNNYSIRASIIR